MLPKRKWPSKEVKKHGLKLVLGAVERVLDDNTYKHNAEHFRQLLSTWNGPESAADLIEEFMMSKRNIQPDPSSK